MDTLNYFYYPAFTANRYLTADMIFEYFSKSEVLPYICYHITNSALDIPFLQIMLQKTPFCNNIIKEELVLPSIIFNRNSENIGDMILADVRRGLQKMNLKNKNKDKDIVFKGILVDINNNCYGLVDLSNIELKYLELRRNTPLWFVLPTEIVNLQSVCNIPVSEKVIELFTYKKPELCALQCHNEQGKYYFSPDVGYTINDYKTSEMELVFGPSRKILSDSETHVYSFYRSFTPFLNENAFNFDRDKERNIGFNRYALFSEDTVNVDTVNIKQFEMFHPLSIYKV